ncbi:MULTISPECIES: spore germination protein [unclassified Paenibacillus]|uniref:spore germination protein n=1 Tax=unclassified Paenibacillus TaxID=185978 RepID=UPI00278353D7|nr:MULTISPECIES: spore germination protein [unclassified Paenibacillus]MDQ0900675.1 spore germination protein [Paenibacillus sp. V4I7]MDQ0920816.1 spore germination protein [Paenibacillus sp. V4I5]
MAYKGVLPWRTKVKKERLEVETIGEIEEELSDKLDANEAWLKQTFSNCSDLIVRKVNLYDSIPCMLVFFKELVDTKQLDDELLKTLFNDMTIELDTSTQLIEQMKSELLPIAQTRIVNNKKETVKQITRGQVVLFVESSNQVLSITMKGKLHRDLQEPNMESVIRGPKIGFIENIDINMGLIRQIIRTPQLKMEQLLVGEVSQTEVVIAYLENVASPEVIMEVRKRISQLDMETVLESGYIEEMIRDAPYSPFPVIQMTERPDVVSASLIEGKVAILVDGTPMVLVAPITFWHAFQTVEDYYTNFIIATFLRWLRYFFTFISLILPSLFIAVDTFHPEMIPTSLILSLASAREPVPFPTLMEIMMMEIAFEAIREAGIRLPRQVGQTISIVGVLVIGQAAVQAGIVSAPIVIVVSLTGIASFLIPSNNMSQAIRILRFPLMLSAGIFGLYGLGVSIIALLIHLVNLRSFGVYYMSPLAPFQFSGILDVFVRAPWWVIHKRQNRIRSK